MTKAADLAKFIGTGFSGKTIQTQKTQFTSTSQISCASNTDVVVTDLTVNITPNFSNSIIQLQAQLLGEWSDQTATWDSTVFFYRDTTKLSHATAGSRNSGVGGFYRAYTDVDNASTPNSAPMYSFFDTPSSTSQITYKVGLRQTRTSPSSLTFNLNRTVDDADIQQSERFISFISATEIAA